MEQEQSDQHSGVREPGFMMADSLTEPWLQWPLVVLGGWLIASPWTLGYASGAMVWADTFSGVAIISLAALAFLRRRPWYALANCFVGLWLLFAPLVLWTPSPAAYANDTVVGALVIAFTLVIPMRMRMKGPDVPPGWSYNPSTWQQRLPIALLGFASFLIARYMAAYQLGHIDTVWEPFFSPGTREVLTSAVSKAWPVSDAGLGAVVYLIEVLSTLMGDERRWRTMPWMVAIFGFAVVPLGVVSIALVIMQPVVVGAWCTLCLISAAFMLLMIPLALDEVVAMCQFLLQEMRKGRPFWHAFFLGGDAGEKAPEHRSSELWRPQAMVWGISLPWNLLVSSLLAVWLLAAPDLLQFGGPAANSDHLVGAIALTVAIIAWAEVGRRVRLLNVPLGLWLLIAPWVLGSSSVLGTWSDVVVGVLLILLSLPRGRVRELYGSADPS